MANYLLPNFAEMGDQPVPLEPAPRGFARLAPAPGSAAEQDYNRLLDQWGGLRWWHDIAAAPGRYVKDYWTTPIPAAAPQPAPQATPAPKAPSAPVPVPAAESPYASIIPKLFEPVTPPPAPNYPAAPTLSGNMPGYPTTPVPQRLPPMTGDYSQMMKYYEQARPAEPKADKKDILLAGLLGALANYDPRGGERLGHLMGRMAAGAAGPAYGEIKSQRQAKQDYEQRLLPQYYALMGNVAGGMEDRRLSREDQRDAVRYANEQAQRDDQFKQAEYALKAQDLQNQMAMGNYNAALQLERLKQDAANMGVNVELMNKKLGIAGLGVFSRGNRANTIGQLPPGAAISQLIGNAIQKNQQIPGLDMSVFMAQAQKEFAANPELRTLMANPQLWQTMVKQRAAALASQHLAQNPQAMNSLLRMYGNTPLGGAPAQVLPAGEAE